MQPNNNKASQNNEDDLDNAIDFGQNQLNLTNQQQNLNLDDDPQTSAKIKQQYQKFMQEMKNLNLGNLNSTTGGQDEGFDNLTNMLGGLLKNLTSEAGLEGDNTDLSKGFEQMFKNLKQDNIQQAAGKLLSQFMDKNLLYEPMLQVKQHYEQYFKNNQDKIQKAQQQRYKNQFNILCEIIKTLDTNPEKKQHLIELFEKMQQYGTPPPGIASTASFM